MYSALRLGEIARLRSRLDITVLHRRLAFVIQEHYNLWSPKTEAGARIVPVHRVLLELRLKEYVEKQQAAGHMQLFSDLKPRGPEGNRGPDFSREFSQYKTRLGIGPGTVFHSFRHSIRTILTNAPADLFRDAWIDAVMGDEGGDDDGDWDEGSPNNRSVGLTIYLKEIDMRNLCVVVDYIHYPVRPEVAGA